MTWDPDYYPINSSITIELNYANVSSAAGLSACMSPKVPNSYGYVTITIDDDWLQGKARNNLTLYIVDDDPVVDQRANIVDGPAISLVHEPAQHYTPPPPTKAPNRLGLVLGLPIGLGFFAIILCGLCIGMRKHRKIGLTNVTGGKIRRYTDQRSRIERLGGSRTNKAIRLGGMGAGASPGYTDNPGDYRYARSETPRSTGGATEQYNETEGSKGNGF